jgi:hypothetical protein
MKKMRDLAINPKKGRKKGKAVRIDLSGRRTTQQEGHCHGSRKWWNPPMQVSTDVNAVGCQSPPHQEKEGRGPIVVEAGERFTTTIRTLRTRTTTTMMLSSWQRLQ